MDSAAGSSLGSQWLDHGLRDVVSAEEQDWNRRTLASPVTVPALACWRYVRPGVVLGAAQRVTGALQAGAALRGIDIATRPSGGGAVITGPWMLGLSVLLPPAHAVAKADLQEGFHRLGRACCQVLRQTGVAASLAERSDIQRSAARAQAEGLDWACFGSVSHGEVVDPAGRKIAGFAQCKKSTGTLLVGGVLFGEPDWSLLCELFGKPASVLGALRTATACVASGWHQASQIAEFCAAFSRAVRLQMADRQERTECGSSNTERPAAL